MRGAWNMAFAGVMALTAVGEADAATAKREAAGTLADGTAVEAVTLTAANGVSARILT